MCLMAVHPQGNDSGSEDDDMNSEGFAGKSKRVLANRQSAHRSRLRKLQYIQVGLGPRIILFGCPDCGTGWGGGGGGVIGPGLTIPSWWRVPRTEPMKPWLSLGIVCVSQTSARTFRNDS